MDSRARSHEIYIKSEDDSKNDFGTIMAQRWHSVLF